MKKKSFIIGRINPNAIKSRDLVTLQEITHGTGTGAHKNRQDRLKRIDRKAKERGWSDD